MRQPWIIYYEPQVLTIYYYTPIYNDYKREKLQIIAEYFHQVVSYIIMPENKKSQNNQTVNNKQTYHNSKTKPANLNLNNSLILQYDFSKVVTKNGKGKNNNREICAATFPNPFLLCCLPR